MKTGLVVISGKPGSGKTAAAIELVSRLNTYGINAYHISIGDRLRSIASGAIESKHSQSVKKHLGRLSLAQPIPSHIPGMVIKEAIDDQPAGLLALDGYPRFKEQLSDFHSIATKIGSGVLSIEMVLPDNTSSKRLLNRSKRTGEASYSPSLIAQRLEEYRLHVSPVVNAIAQEYKHIEINADQSFDEVVTSMYSKVLDYL